MRMLTVMHCDTLGSSGFAGDVMVSHNKLNGTSFVFLSRENIMVTLLHRFQANFSSISRAFDEHNV